MEDAESKKSRYCNGKARFENVEKEHEYGEENRVREHKRHISIHRSGQWVACAQRVLEYGAVYWYEYEIYADTDE